MCWQSVVNMSIYVYRLCKLGSQSHFHNYLSTPATVVSTQPMYIFTTDYVILLEMVVVEALWQMHTLVINSVMCTTFPTCL